MRIAHMADQPRIFASDTGFRRSAEAAETSDRQPPGADHAWALSTSEPIRYSTRPREETRRDASSWPA